MQTQTNWGFSWCCEFFYFVYWHNTKLTTNYIFICSFCSKRAFKITNAASELRNVWIFTLLCNVKPRWWLRTRQQIWLGPNDGLQLRRRKHLQKCFSLLCLSFCPIYSSRNCPIRGRYLFLPLHNISLSLSHIHTHTQHSHTHNFLPDVSLSIS